MLALDMRAASSVQSKRLAYICHRRVCILNSCMRGAASVNKSALKPAACGRSIPRTEIVIEKYCLDTVNMEKDVNRFDHWAFVSCTCCTDSSARTLDRHIQDKSNHLLSYQFFLNYQCRLRTAGTRAHGRNSDGHSHRKANRPAFRHFWVRVHHHWACQEASRAGLLHTVRNCPFSQKLNL